MIKTHKKSLGIGLSLFPRKGWKEALAQLPEEENKVEFFVHTFDETEWTW